MNVWAAMLIVAAAFMLLMSLALILRKRGTLGAEGSRKLMHIGMGLVATGFPWLFDEAWPVIILTSGFVILLLAFRVLPLFQKRLGHVMCGVSRFSLGEIYFPIVVGFLFVASDGVWIEFVIPMLVLTLADSAAALIGKRFGQLHYLADEGNKSWEGSLVFVLVAWLCVTIRS